MDIWKEFLGNQKNLIENDKDLDNLCLKFKSVMYERCLKTISFLFNNFKELLVDCLQNNKLKNFFGNFIIKKKSFLLNY